MPRAFTLCLCWVVLSVTQLQADSLHKVTLPGHTFSLPKSCTIEVVANSPLVSRPITADFDAQGRLYVSEVAGPLNKPDVLAQKKLHRIVRLEDTDGDGKFDKKTLFADGLPFPEGTLWYAGSLYVAAPPCIWKLTDTDGDGVADQRVEWFQGKTLTGCANDLHGPYLGPDGWIYWCKGAFAKQTHQIRGKEWSTRASHIFRCRPDGTGLEPVMTGGMDNPVDVTFTRTGERIFTTTFFQRPANGKRDGLIHAWYGGLYGKEHDVVDEHPRTTPGLQPVLTHLGPAAPCGLHRLESGRLGEKYRDNLFACLFNMHKITRHVLQPEGAGYTTKDDDFLVSSNLDFHPTDVLEDADGSLLVIDTGGWYKLCCPTSTFEKADILGAIYRIRPLKAPKLDDPRGVKVAWDKLTQEELLTLLGDPRVAVRRRATESLAKQGEKILPALLAHFNKSKNAVEREQMLWLAMRLPCAEASKLLRSALQDQDDTLVRIALHGLSLEPGRHAALPSSEIQSLLTRSLPIRRATAELLGRVRESKHVPLLMKALPQVGDDVALTHALTYALLEIGDKAPLEAGLTDANARVRQACLMVLEQLPGSKLTPQQVAQELTAPEAGMKEVASWVLSRHPDWGGELADFFRTRLKAKLSAPEQVELAQQLSQLAKHPAIQALLAEQLQASRDKAQTTVLLKAMAGTNLKQVPSSWSQALHAQLLRTPQPALPTLLQTIRALPLTDTGKLAEALLALGQSKDVPNQQRLDALAAIPGGMLTVSAESFAFLCAQTDREESVATRQAAVEALTKAKLSPEQLHALLEVVKTVGPMELHPLLEAYTKSTEEALGLKLLASLSKAASLSSLRLDTLKLKLAKYSPKVKAEIETLLPLVRKEHAQQKARIDELLPLVKTGDIRRGQEIFQQTKTACASCHTVGYLGGSVGPDLTRVGQVRTERDLLEAILFPSASLVQGYEAVTIALKKGKVYDGLLRKAASDEVLLVLGPGQELILSRDEIEEMRPSALSLMPTGLEKQLTVQEIVDLVAFLKACR